jgi:AcrR family transcriptional regulator
LSDSEGLEKWVDAGIAELARGGVEAVRVEVLAERLGVTKGGFYRRFRDRQALLHAMLETWADGRIAAIEQQSALNGKTAAERLKALLGLYSQRSNPHGMSIELAMRQWARTDAVAEESVARVDAGRMKAVTGLYIKAGCAPQEAEARALLFYAFSFGESLIFLERSAAKRAKLLAACVDVVLESSGRAAPQVKSGGKAKQRVS